MGQGVYSCGTWVVCLPRRLAKARLAGEGVVGGRRGREGGLQKGLSAAVEAYSSAPEGARGLFWGPESILDHPPGSERGCRKMVWPGRRWAGS